MSSTYSHNMVNFGPLAAEIDPYFEAPLQISTAFASWQRYWSDVGQRKPTKLCTVFGRLLDWYTTYTFSGVLAPLRNFARCKIHFASSISCVLVFLNSTTTGSVIARHLSSGREPNFAALRTGRHLYSAGRPSRWALAHILVVFHFIRCPNVRSY